MCLLHGGSIMSDWYRSHHIPLNGVAIKMITIMTIKKYMKRLGNYDSYLVFNLEQLFHCHLFVLGDPSRSVHTSKAAAAAVLVEEDVIKLDLHEGGAWRQHLIMALSNSSAPEGESEGRKEVWTSLAEQSRSCCAKYFKERPQSETKHSRLWLRPGWTWPQRAVAIGRFSMWCQCDITAYSLAFTDHLSPLSTHFPSSQERSSGNRLADDGMPGMLESCLPKSQAFPAQSKA